MATHEKNPKCEHIIQKIISGEVLDDAEKSHLAVCERCMAQIVNKLDEAARKSAPAFGETNGKIAHPTPEAQKALEQGRRVFEREFGISLSRRD